MILCSKKAYADDSVFGSLWVKISTNISFVLGLNLRLF